MAKASIPCSEPGCPELAPCPTHRRTPWAGTAPRQRGGNRQRSAVRILTRHGRRCYLCGQPATAVDHVVNLAQGGSDTDANKRPICDHCHAAKTKAEAAEGRRRARGCG